MNSEKAIISQIKSLKDIKPDHDWVILNKARLLGSEALNVKRPAFSVLFDLMLQRRMVLAALVMLGALSGTVFAAQGSLPGEPLYAVKKATERGMAIAMGQNNDPAANLQLAAKRLEEIDLISQKNLVKNLPAAFYEYKTAKAAAKKEVAAKVKENPAKAGQIVKEAGVAIKNINDKEKQVYGVLGVDESASSTNNGIENASDKQIVESLVDYFKKGAVLSYEQASDLARVKKLYEDGKYGEAIDVYLSSSLNN